MNEQRCGVCVCVCVCVYIYIYTHIYTIDTMEYYSAMNRMKSYYLQQYEWT